MCVSDLDENGLAEFIDWSGDNLVDLQKWVQRVKGTAVLSRVKPGCVVIFIEGCRYRLPVGTSLSSWPGVFALEPPSDQYILWRDENGQGQSRVGASLLNLLGQGE